jgi:hypothetical protein
MYVMLYRTVNPFSFRFKQSLSHYHSVRAVDSLGYISTVAGTGTRGYNGDNILATTAKVTCIIIIDTLILTNYTNDAYTHDSSTDQPISPQT